VEINNATKLIKNSSSHLSCLIYFREPMWLAQFLRSECLFWCSGRYCQLRMGHEL